MIKVTACVKYTLTVPKSAGLRHISVKTGESFDLTNDEYVAVKAELVAARHNKLLSWKEPPTKAEQAARDKIAATKEAFLAARASKSTSLPA